MAADASFERQQAIFALQATCGAFLTANKKLNDYLNLYNGGGLSGTFLDADCAVNNTTKHMVGVDIGTFTANLQTIQATLTASSNAILNNLAKCVGGVPPAA
jgi:hypothetical protein